MGHFSNPFRSSPRNAEIVTEREIRSSMLTLATEMEPPPPPPAEFLCFNVNQIPFRMRLSFVAGGALICAILFAWLQEMVFRVPDFKFGGFMALITSLTFVACAAMELLMKGNFSKRKGDLKDYALLSLCTAGGIYFTNWSLTYIDYPMRVMFKSSKLLPVMVMGLFIAKRKHTQAEYGVAALLVLAIICFALGDFNGAAPKFDIRGICLISVGVILDAITSNFEEQRFFREKNCIHEEVIFYAFGIGSIWTLVTIYTSGELSTAIDHSMLHPEVYSLTIMFSAMGYLSIVFVLLLIKLFNASVAEAVKSVRKVVTICLSFFFFGKSITSMHLVGMFLFVASVALGMKTKMTTSAPATSKGSPAIGPIDTSAEGAELLAKGPPAAQSV